MGTQRYKEMGIQRWRLKSSYAQARLKGSEALIQENSTNNPSDQKVLHQAAAQLSDEQPSSMIDKGEQVLTDQNSQPSLPALSSEEESLNNFDERNSSSPNALDSLGWIGLQAMIDSREDCPSCGHGNSILGSGAPDARWLFVLDAPTTRELTEQSLCAGRAGDLFDAMLRALSLKRDEVYISSVFKCAPTADLSATPQCNRVLHRQIELIAPEVIVTFGEFAGQAVIKANDSLESLRANSQRCPRTSISVVPTYSPVQMLSNPSLKSLVWEDLKRAMARLDSAQ